MDHTFVVCAYKENPYLEKCIQSVLNQTKKSNVLISTSTPNEYIKQIAGKYNLKLVINEGAGDEADNFNFAYSQAQSKYVTLCHQDDYYSIDYLKYIEKAEKRHKNTIIFFTDYFEDRSNHIIKVNFLLLIKRILLFPLRFDCFSKSIKLRSFILSLGNPICCPSVTYNKSVISSPGYEIAYRAVLDWKVWIRLSKYAGSFCYIAKPLVYHRIHDDSETSKTIQNNSRSKQELEVYQEMWPKWMASILKRIYGNAQKNNKL